MTYDSFDFWFETVKQFAGVPVTADDQWYDAYLATLAPEEAVRIIRPKSTQAGLRSAWSAIRNFFD